MITTFNFGLKIGNFLPFADKNTLKIVFSPHHSLAKGKSHFAKGSNLIKLTLFVKLVTTHQHSVSSVDRSGFNRTFTTELPHKL